MLLCIISVNKWWRKGCFVTVRGHCQWQTERQRDILCFILLLLKRRDVNIHLRQTVGVRPVYSSYSQNLKNKIRSVHCTRLFAFTADQAAKLVWLISLSIKNVLLRLPTAQGDTFKLLHFVTVPKLWRHSLDNHKKKKKGNRTEARLRSQKCWECFILCITNDLND